MVNQKDILARLQAGESADSIAQEMVNALNAANAEYAEAQAKAAHNARKVEIIAEMADLVKEYVETFHPDSHLAEAVKSDFDAEEVVEMLDGAIVEMERSFAALKQLESIFGDIKERPVAVKTGKIEPDAIGAFLKANGLA